MCDQAFSNTPLPSGWPESVRSAVIYVISLAHYAITCARGWAANSANARVRLAAENDRLNQEIQLLREELRVKDECTRRVVIPLRREDMRRELICHLDWYNEHRPHEFLDGRTPNEVYHNRPAANEEPRIEVRPLWPTEASCATPVAAIDGEPGQKIELVISYYAGRKHLPIIQFKRVA